MIDSMKLKKWMIQKKMKLILKVSEALEMTQYSFGF